jgi:hypothetical protein
MKILPNEKEFGSGGITKFPQFKRSDKICPNCLARRVNRINRKCDACQITLLWDGDDANYFNDRMDYWYMWHKSAFGLTGWYTKEYWDKQFHTFKY